MRNVQTVKKEIDKKRSEIADLEAEEREIERLDNQKSAIKPLKDYTDKQKIKFFDSLYVMAEKDLARLIETDGYHDSDSQYFFEAVMEILARDQTGNKQKFWDYYNRLAAY